MRWIGAALVVLASAGCDQVFNLHRPADAGPDVPVVDVADGSVDVACSTISMLYDTFDVDNIMQCYPGSFAAVPGSLAVEGGRLAMKNLAPDNYVTLESIYYYDLRDRAYTVHITDDGDFPTAGAYLNVTLHGERPDNYALFTRQGGRLQFVVRDGVTDHTVTSLDYVTNDFPYQRIRVEGTTILFETSTDGVQFTMQGSRSLDGFEFVRATIQTYRGPSTPVYNVYVEQIGDGSPPSPACPVSQLREDFSGTSLGPQWSRTVAFQGMFQLDGGSFLATTNGVTSGQAVVALQPSRVYDLTEGAFWVEIPRMMMPSPQKTVSFNIAAPGGDSISIDQSNGTLYARAYHNSAALNPFSGPYVAATMRWWRISNMQGVTRWEISPDGVAWTPLSTTTSLVGFDRVAIVLQAYSTAVDEDAARFDNVNLP